MRSAAGLAALAVGGILAHATVFHFAEVPVDVALQEHVQVIPEPPRLDMGRIELGVPILQNVHCAIGNTNVSLWAAVVDGPGGWVLAPEPGPDQYAVKVNEIPLTSEPQQVFPLVQAYGTGTVPVMYYAPTSDSFGAGVNQGYALRIEARESAMEPGEPGID